MHLPLLTEVPGPSSFAKQFVNNIDNGRLKSLINISKKKLLWIQKMQFKRIFQEQHPPDSHSSLLPLYFILVSVNIPVVWAPSIIYSPL